MAEINRQAILSTQLAALNLPVEEAILPRLLWLLDELLRWNRRINLTAITDPLAGVEKHLVDSLTPLPLLAGHEKLLDIGSGAGFPALPLKVALPGLQVVSVDAVGRKIAFQRHVIRQLGLSGIEAVAERVETLAKRPEFAGQFQVVVARAFASLVDFADLARPFMAPGGLLVAMKGEGGEQELAAAAGRLQQLELVLESIQKLRLPGSKAMRTLVLLRQEGG